LNRRGAYSNAANYVLGDVITNQGASWISIAPSSVGNAPPTLPTTSNVYWALLTEKGAKGDNLDPDAQGPFSGRAAYCDQAPPFSYLSEDGDGDENTTAGYFLKQSATSGNWGPCNPIGGVSDYNDLLNKPTLPAGGIVGTSDTQTLTNKTLDGARITNGFVSDVRFKFLNEDGRVEWEVDATPDAVNNLRAVAAQTTNYPTLAAVGADDNIGFGFGFAAKGNGGFYLGNGLGLILSIDGSSQASGVFAQSFGKANNVSGDYGAAFGQSNTV